MNSFKLFFPLLTFLLTSITVAQTSVGLSSPTTNTLDVVVQNENDQLSYIAWTGRKWSDWQALKSPPYTNLSVQTISVESGRTEIIGVSDKGSVYHAFLKNNKLSDWQVIGLYTKSFPEVVSWGKGRFDIFITNKKGEILHTYFTNGNWSKRWKNHGGNVRGNQSPSVVAQAKGKLDIFYRSKASLIKHKSWNKNAWSDWETVPGMRLSSPVVASSMANGRLDLFTRGSKGEVMNSSKIFGRWSKWVNIGKDISGQKGIQVHKRGENLDIFYINRPGQLLHQTANSKGRSKWSIIGKTNQLPSTTSWSSNRTDISFLNGKGELQQAYFNGKKWSSLRNKGRFKLPQMDLVNNPTPTIVNKPISSNLIDENELSGNEIEDISNIPPNVEWVEKNGMICQELRFQEEEIVKPIEKMAGDVPAGIVPGAIIKRFPFENSGVIRNSTARRKNFRISAPDASFPFNQIDINTNGKPLSYARIKDLIDKELRSNYNQPIVDYSEDPNVTYIKSVDTEKSLTKLGINVQYLTAKAKLSLNKSSFSSSETFLFYIESEYFTLKSEPLKDSYLHGNSQNNLLVESVTYGRQFLIKYERRIEESALKREATLSNDFVVHQEASIKEEFKESLEDVNITAYSIGGDELSGFKPLALLTSKVNGNEAEDSSTTDSEDSSTTDSEDSSTTDSEDSSTTEYSGIKDVIDRLKNLSNFSSINFGYPIHYKLRNLDTNQNIHFKYRSPEVIQKNICFPESTTYRVALKAIRKSEDGIINDEGPRAEFGKRSTIRVEIDENDSSTSLKYLGDLLQGGDRYGANPYRTHSEIKRPGILKVHLNKSEWVYTPGYKYQGNNDREPLPEFVISQRSVLDDHELKFKFDLSERDGSNRNESYRRNINISIVQLLLENPDMHEYGAEKVIKVDFSGDNKLDFLVEFIPLRSTAPRLSKVRMSSNSNYNLSKSAFSETNGDFSSNFEYTMNGNEFCMSSIESTALKDGSVPSFANSSSSFYPVPGSIFKINDSGNISPIIENIRRTPLEVVIEDLTSQGSKDSSIMRYAINTPGNFLRNSVITTGIRSITDDRNMDLYATANSNLNVQFTSSEETAKLSLGYSANSPFLDVDLNFIKGSTKSRLYYYAVISRDFFRVSARPIILPITNPETDQTEYDSFWTYRMHGDNSLINFEDYLNFEEEKSFTRDRINYTIQPNDLRPLYRTSSDPFYGRSSGNKGKNNSESTLAVPVVSYDSELSRHYYIGEVTYGQRIVVRFSKEVKEKETATALKIKGRIKAFSAEIKAGFESGNYSENIEVKAYSYGNNNPEQANVFSIIDQQGITDLFNFLSGEENRNDLVFAPHSGGIGKPVSFKAYTINGNMPLMHDITSDLKTDYSCYNDKIDHRIRLSKRNIYGPWSDGGTDLNIAGTIKAFFVLDAGRIWTPSSSLFDSNGNDYIENIPETNSNADKEDIDVFDFTHGVSRPEILGRFSHRDIINGVMYLQYYIRENNRRDDDSRFHHISEPIPISELLSGNPVHVYMPVNASGSKGLKFEIVSY